MTGRIDTVRFPSFLALLTAVLAASWAVAIEPIPDPGGQLDFAKDIGPLFAKYCLDCHTGQESDGKLALDQLDPNGGFKVRKSWQKVRDNLHSNLMPPADLPQPSSEERKKIVAWLDSHPLRIDCSGPVHPGRVTIRRLNRDEYNNTIRDLCGVDFKPAEDFPNDDVGYGFDNIGDVLSMPPILLEKYLAAAETVAQKAILTFDENSAQSRKEKGRQLASNGEVVFESDFAPGTYILKARAAADQAGPDRAKMALKLDDKELEVFETRNRRRGDFRNYEHKLEIAQGRHRFAAAFINDYYEPNNEDRRLRGDRNLDIEYLEIVGPLGARPEQLPASHAQIIFVEPSGEKSPEDCAREIFKRFASRAYRRPASDDEVARVMQIFSLAKGNGERFERCIQLGVQAILVSPSFLFRVEQEPGPNDPGGIRTLNEYELATRLSYFLWSSMPDSELLHLALEGKLRQNLDDQVRRMLKDPKSNALVQNFAGQWLQLRSLDIITPDVKRFPEWGKELREAMRHETELFFAHIMREDRSVLEFIDADYTFVNERLAKHYGLPDVTGSEFRKVSVPAEQRGGLLGQASILTVTSNPNRTSPVKRGKWILENLLAEPPPPAPPNVPPLEEVGGRRRRRSEEEMSLRQKLEIHRSAAACASCHQLMDPLGFGLENYNAIGAWRTEDGKFPIDSTGVLPSGDEFKGVRDLRNILKKRDNEFRRCLAERLMTYALGRGLELDDECTLRAIAAEVGQKENKFSALVLAIVHSDQFQKRASVRSKME
jgi:hypothetical protein